MKKKKQSAARNADTQFINNMWRLNEHMRAERSRKIRERERAARARARNELESILAAT